MPVRAASAIALLLNLAACAGEAAPAPGPTTPGPGDTDTTDTSDTAPPTTPEVVHSDADCLSDAEELALGTDPLLPDTDGDGTDDCAERDCTSDPLDAGEVCYGCGWPHADPGTLASTGADVGDVVADMVLWDQCLEPLHLWDLYGRYVLVFSTTQWCGTCLEEAQALSAEAAELLAVTGQEVLPVVALFQDALGNAPLTTVGADYAAALSLAGFPVTADQVGATLSALPYAGDFLPGKCVLSPELVILGCHAGEGGLDAVTAWIEADAALR